MSRNKTKILRLAEYSEYQEVKDYLEKYLPISLPMFQVLSAEISFDLSHAMCPKKIYISDGENKFEFIFVTGLVSSTKFQNCAAFWDIESLKKDDVLQYLLSVPNFFWDKGFTMICQNRDMAATIDELMDERSLSTKELKVSRNVPCRLYAIQEKEEIIEPRLPEGYYFGKLRPHHVPFVFKNWPYSEGESIGEYQILFELLPSCAIYKNGDDELQNPVSYVFMYAYGLMGQTFTVPEHRNLGLASAATLKLSIMARKKFNLKPVIASEAFNKPSHAMHEKIGFKLQTFVVWKSYKNS